MVYCLFLLDGFIDICMMMYDEYRIMFGINLWWMARQQCCYLIDLVGWLLDEYKIITKKKLKTNKQTNKTIIKIKIKNKW